MISWKISNITPQNIRITSAVTPHDYNKIKQKNNIFPPFLAAFCNNLHVFYLQGWYKRSSQQTREKQVGSMYALDILFATDMCQKWGIILLWLPNNHRSCDPTA